MQAEMRKQQKDFREAKHTLVKTLAKDAQATAKAMFGHPNPNWPELAPRTVRHHQTHSSNIVAAGFDPEDSMLFVTGELRDSVKRKTGRYVSDVGTNEQKMIIQEFGGPNPSGGGAIPPRPVFEPTAEEVFARMQKHIDQVMGKMFGGNVRVNVSATGRGTIGGSEGDDEGEE